MGTKLIENETIGTKTMGIKTTVTEIIDIEIISNTSIAAEAIVIYLDIVTDQLVHWQCDYMTR